MYKIYQHGEFRRVVHSEAERVAWEQQYEGINAVPFRTDRATLPNAVLDHPIVPKHEPEPIEPPKVAELTRTDAAVLFIREYYGRTQAIPPISVIMQTVEISRSVAADAKRRAKIALDLR